MTMSNNVRDNTERHRFELDVDGVFAFSQYKLEGDTITFMHTEVPKQLQGKGIGSALVRGALANVRMRGLKVAAKCSFVKAYLARHPEDANLAQ
jgi:uncharacterized protein